MKRSNIIWLILIAIAVYIGFVLVPVYYRHQMMVLEVKGEIKVAHMYDEEEILDHIIEKVKEWDIPVNTDEIVIDRREDDIIISMRYHVDKTFFSQYERRFYFKIREKGSLNSDSY